MEQEFKKGDKVILITKGQLPIESCSWAKQAGFRLRRRYEIEEVHCTGWISLVGMAYHHPPQKFKLAKNQK